MSLPWTSSVPCGQKGQAVSWGKALAEYRDRWSGPSALPCEATPGVLCPLLDSSAQDRQGTTGMGPVRIYKDDNGTGVHLLKGESEEAGPASWFFFSGAQRQEKGQRAQTGTLEYPFEQDKNFLLWVLPSTVTGYPRSFRVTSLELFKICLVMVLCHLLWVKLLYQQRGN